MKSFLKKLAHYDGSKFLKRALGEAPVAPPAAPVQTYTLDQFKRGWNMNSGLVTKALQNLQAKIPQVQKSILQQTGVMTWVSGTSHEYREVDGKLSQASENIKSLLQLINGMNEVITKSKSVSGIAPLMQQAGAIKKSYEDLKPSLPSGDMGKTGWLPESLSKDIVEDIKPLRLNMQYLDQLIDNLVQVIGLIPNVVGSSASTGTTAGAENSAATANENIKKIMEDPVVKICTKLISEISEREINTVMNAEPGISIERAIAYEGGATYKEYHQSLKGAKTPKEVEQFATAKIYQDTLSFQILPPYSVVLQLRFDTILAYHYYHAKSKGQQGPASKGQQASAKNLSQQSEYTFGKDSTEKTKINTISDRKRQFMSSIQGKEPDETVFDARYADIKRQYDNKGKGISKAVANALINNLQQAWILSGGDGGKEFTNI